MQAVYRQVGSNVKKLRQKAKLTQAELAHKSGLHVAHVGEIERGESNVTISTLKTIADTFNVKVVDLVKGL